MTDIATLRREQAEFAAQQAYLRGRVDAAIDDAIADPGQMELLRAMAWHQKGHALTLGKDGAVNGMPDGWPEGVDREQFVAEWADGQRCKFAPAEDAPPSAATPSPGVSRFREKLGS